MKKIAALAVLAGVAFGANAQITTTQFADANTLAGILLPTGSPLSLVSASLKSHTDSLGGLGASAGYFIAGPNNYNLGASGIVLSSGAVSAYGSGGNFSTGFSGGGNANSDASDEALLDPITGGSFSHFDVTRLDLVVDAGPDATVVAFDVVFGSEEWSEFVGSNFIDGFGLYVNGVNVAFEGGLPININHPGMAGVVETELDGVLVGANGPKLKFVVPAVPGLNTLTFIVADASDTVLDTTVYIEGLVPAPSSLALVGLAGLAASRRRRA